MPPSQSVWFAIRSKPACAMPLAGDAILRAHFRHDRRFWVSKVVVIAVFYKIPKVDASTVPPLCREIVMSRMSPMDPKSHTVTRKGTHPPHTHTASVDLRQQA